MKNLKKRKKKLFFCTYILIQQILHVTKHLFFHLHEWDECRSCSLVEVNCSLYLIWILYDRDKYKYPDRLRLAKRTDLYLMLLLDFDVGPHTNQVYLLLILTRWSSPSTQICARLGAAGQMSCQQYGLLPVFANKVYLISCIWNIRSWCNVPI